MGRTAAKRAGVRRASVAKYLRSEQRSALRMRGASSWCQRWGSNPHDPKGHGILSPARLPIPPLWLLSPRERLRILLGVPIWVHCLRADGLQRNWRYRSSRCIRMLVELVPVPYAGSAPMTGNTEILRISFYGIVVDCSLPGGITVESTTSMDPAKHAQVTGQVDYFEVLRLSGPLEACCGVPGRWSFGT